MFLYLVNINNKIKMNKIRQEKAFISTVVALSVSFFIIILSGILVSTSNSNKITLDSSKRIKDIYEHDVNRVDEVYNDVLTLEESFEPANIEVNEETNEEVNQSTNGTIQFNFDLPIMEEEEGEW